MKEPESGDLYMSPNKNFHLFINSEQYVHLVAGPLEGKKQIGVDGTLQTLRSISAIDDRWVFICNVGALLCTVTKQEFEKTHTILKINEWGLT